MARTSPATARIGSKKRKRARAGQAAAPSRRGAGPELPSGEPSIAYRMREGHLLEVDDVTSARMGRVRQKATQPELFVRSALAELGQRYRLQNRDLPGSPDLANRRARWAIFVHGCFWHRHGCSATTTPTRNRVFWEAKFARNVARDAETIAALEKLRYRVIVIWECQTKRRGEDAKQNLARAFGGQDAIRTRAPTARPRRHQH